MTSNTPPRTPRAKRPLPSSDKKARLKAALKANLQRRKAQARRRKHESGQ